MTAQQLPDEALERILARLPTTQDRVCAAAVCRAWRQLTSQRNLRLWQAVIIEHSDGWESLGEDYHPDHSDADGAFATARMRNCLLLQQWLTRRSSSLLQLQCNTAFNTPGKAEDGLLTALLAALPSAAPLLQALHLDIAAAYGMVNSSQAGIAGLGGRLRQLAILGLQYVSDGCLMAALEQLPLLQDLAIMFLDGDSRHNMSQWLRDDKAPAYQLPDIMRLADAIAASCPALQTLALGNLPVSAGPPFSSAVLTKNAAPLPPSLSRLTALTSLALHDITWECSPAGLPDMPQLRRLCLRGGCRPPSMLNTELPHQLSSLTGLEALQVTLPLWVGRLPTNLMQLVLSRFIQKSTDPGAEAARPGEAVAFLRTHLPQLRSLRHLALHNLHDIGDSLLQDVCAAARALPHLISLHLVNCNIGVLPRELCALSRLQLLDLSQNPMLHPAGCRSLAQAPLHELVSCKWLDLHCEGQVFAREVPLQPDTIAVLAGMPALQQLALAPTVPPEPFPHPDAPPTDLTLEELEEQLAIPSVYADFNLTLDETEVALLARHRAPGLPPINIVPKMPISRRWGAVAFELPFEPVNEVLGVQLDRRIISGVPP